MKFCNTLMRLRPASTAMLVAMLVLPALAFAQAPAASAPPAATGSGAPPAAAVPAVPPVPNAPAAQAPVMRLVSRDLDRGALRPVERRRPMPVAE